MQVLFDAFELAPGTGKSMGIYNYARNLLPALSKCAGSSVRIVVACNSACAPDFDVVAPNVSVRVLYDGVPGRLTRQVWWRGRAALETARVRADTYLSPKGFLPSGMNLLSPRTCTAIVVHDLIPLWYRDHHPGYFGGLEEFIVNRALIGSVRRADRIIAISQATADDIRRRVGRSDGVGVVYNGVPVSPPGEPPLPGGYILAVTSKLPHKNAAGVIETYKRYRMRAENPLPLVICGFDPGPAEGIHSVSGLTDRQLHGCYAHAALCLFLSRIEGFGFPPVEAMAHGTPVICSDIPVLREVTRGAATYVPVDDAERAALAIENVLAGNRLSAAELAAAVSGFTWQECAKGVLDELSKCP